MKQIFSKTLMCAGMAATLLTGCMENDLYNAEAVREKAEKAFGMTIDPNQDWNMIEVVKANISIKEDALSNYKFKIYTANPLYEECGAALLAEKSVSTDAQGKANANLTFDMPSYMEYVYVARVDEHGRRLVKSAKVSEGTLITEFGGSTVGTRGAETGNDLSSTKKELPYTEDDVKNFIANGYNVENGLEGDEPWGKQKIDNISNLEKITWRTNLTHTLVVTSNYEENSLSLEVSGYTKYLGQENGKPKYSTDWNPAAPHDFKIVIARNPTTGKPTTYTLAGNVTQNGETFRKTAKIDIIVAEGGILEIKDELLIRDNSRIIVMPGGKIIDGTPNDGKTLRNEGESIYNAGKIEVEVIDLTTSGPFIYNAESGIIKSKEIQFNNSGTTLTNWGKIETEQITGDVKEDGTHSDWGQGTVNNGCLLRVTDVFYAASLNQAGGTAIECKEIRINGNLTMRENSILRAEIMKMQNLNIQYCGASGEHALISTKCMAQFENDVTITDGFYFEVGEFDDTEHRKLDMEGWLTNKISGTSSTLSAVGEAPLAIIPDKESDPNDLSKAECTGKGNIPTDYVEETETPSTFTYAFEDQNKDGGDYDMNDVVLYCSAPKDGKITVTLAAAGASKNLTVHFKNKQANTDVALFNGQEIHDLFDVGKKELVNTGSGPNCEEITAEIAVSEGFSYGFHGDFYIKDEQGRESHIPAFDSQLAERGNVPYGICVPAEWGYPAERCPIKDAYPDFETWAGDMTKCQKWYENKVAANIIQMK